MTPLQALQDLEKACGELACTRNVHAHLLECSKVVGQALMDAEAQKKIAADRSKPD